MSGIVDRSDSILAAGGGGDFIAHQSGGLIVLTPITGNGLEWLLTNLKEDASSFEGSLVIDPRYFEDIFNGILAAGLKFERRNASPAN